MNVRSSSLVLRSACPSMKDLYEQRRFWNAGIAFVMTGRGCLTTNFIFNVYDITLSCVVWPENLKMSRLLDKWY